MDQFCPNCRFFMGQDMLTVCPKCGYRIRREPQPSPGLLREFEDAAGLRIQETEEVGDHPKCPECGNRLRKNIGDALQFDLLGKEITVQSISALHMDISKRATTQVQIEFDSWSCVNEHKFYVEFRENTKRLCPGCKGPMVKFGDEVLSCKRCRINLTKDSYVYIEPEELLAEQGYVHHPEPFESDEG
jgi:predicted nucleic acid-binding Zn ribbon protein